MYRKTWTKYNILVHIILANIWILFYDANIYEKSTPCSMDLFWLVVWNMAFDFHNIWDNPSHWDNIWDNIFQDGYCTTNQFFLGIARSVAFRQGMQAAELWTCGSLRAADRSSSHQDAWPVTIFIVATEVDMGHLTLQKPIMSSNLPHLSGIYMDLWMFKMLKSVNRGWTPKPRRGYATGCSSQEFWNTHTQRFGMSCGGWGSNKSVSSLEDSLS